MARLVLIVARVWHVALPKRETPLARAVVRLAQSSGVLRCRLPVRLLCYEGLLLIDCQNVRIEKPCRHKVVKPLDTFNILLAEIE